MSFGRSRPNTTYSSGPFVNLPVISDQRRFYKHDETQCNNRLQLALITDIDDSFMGLDYNARELEGFSN